MLVGNKTLAAIIKINYHNIKCTRKAVSKINMAHRCCSSPLIYLALPHHFLGSLSLLLAGDGMQGTSSSSDSLRRLSSMCLRIICMIAFLPSPSLGKVNSSSLASLSTTACIFFVASGLFRNLGAGESKGQTCLMKLVIFFFLC